MARYGRDYGRSAYDREYRGRDARYDDNFPGFRDAPYGLSGGAGWGYGYGAINWDRYDRNRSGGQGYARDFRGAGPRERGGYDRGYRNFRTR